MERVDDATLAHLENWSAGYIPIVGELCREIRRLKQLQGAAPDLLETCEAVLEFLPLVGRHVLAFELAARLRAVIAKATGENRER